MAASEKCTVDAGKNHPGEELPPLATCQQYQALMAVAEAIVFHRDLQSLFHDLAGRLRQMVRFDYLVLLLHEAPTNA